MKRQKIIKQLIDHYGMKSIEYSESAEKCKEDASMADILTALSAAYAVFVNELKQLLK